MGKALDSEVASRTKEIINHEGIEQKGLTFWESDEKISLHQVSTV
jgi:hypothetical protein